jgi:tetratricopeptide (TPR) repeat protein
MKDLRMKRIVLLSCFLYLFILPQSYGQTKSEIRDMFSEAEMYVLFEEYQDALPIYLDILKLYPNDNNIKYRIGQCYLNTPGEKEKAISYLEAAVKNINPKYKEGKVRETGAPYDALYYLANAYRINNQIDKALSTYEQFQKNLDPTIYDTTIIRLQIESCTNAKKLMSIPVFVKEKNLGDIINERFSEFNPVISNDENTLFYSKSLQLYDAVFYSKKENGIWTAPVNMNPELGVDEDYYPSSVSDDGKELYLYRTDNYDGNIYVSKLINGTWSAVTKLNDNINTKYWESHASVSHDGKKLYFTSNRKGGYGGLDIYVSERDSTGDWGIASNLGPVINTPYNEDTPFLGKDDKTLFFSSRGHYNMGGYDIFYSTFLENGEWSVPLNVGYPLNTTDDDLFFDPVNDGYEAYFSKYDSTGFGNQDIFRVEVFSTEHPRKFYVTGIAKIKDLLTTIKDSIKISVFNTKNFNEPIVVYSDPITGAYQFEVENGTYEITFEADGTEKITKTADFLINNPSDSFVLPGTLLPKADFIADLNVRANQNISVTTGDTIEFPLVVEPKSILTIQHWLGDSLISSEVYQIKDSTFIYKTIPLTGDNRINFQLTDRFGNSTSSDIFLSKQNLPKQELVERPEYSRIIAQRQIAVLSELLANRADEDLKKIIQNPAILKQQFGTVDDLIAYIKEEAAKANISTEKVDELALKVAVMDNILSQTAVDLMAKYSQGDLQAILSLINVSQSGLKSWTDLQEYLSGETNGKVKPEDVNSVASDILADVDPEIANLRAKTLIIIKQAPFGDQILKALNENDLKKIKKAGSWLQSLYNESIKQGMSSRDFSNMLASISSVASADLKQFIDELILQADKDLALYLKGLDLKKFRIRTPSDLIYHLLANMNKGQYTEESLFTAIAKMTAAKDLSEASIVSQLKTFEKSRFWVYWVVIGIVMVLWIIFWKRRKKKRTINK